jgi:molecular chaperone GrpE (heat shock protein)
MPNCGSGELEQLRGERDQLLDRLARLQAEFDNARKREVKERRTRGTTRSRIPSSRSWA